MAETSKPAAAKKTPKKKPAAGQKQTPARKQQTNANAWDRRENESDPAWKAFLCYRDLGLDRSLAKARIKLGRPDGYMRTVEEWSSKYEWRLRVQAWDDAELKRADNTELNARNHGRVRERKNRRGFLNAMQKKLESMIISVDLTEPDEVRALTALFDKVMTHSRQEFGDNVQKVAPTDPTGDKPYLPFDVNRMTDDEMEAALADFFGKTGAYPKP